MVDARLRDRVVLYGKAGGWKLIYCKKNKKCIKYKKLKIKIKNKIIIKNYVRKRQ